MARILVVEDESDISQVLVYNLGQAGHDVSVASNGQAGLDITREDPPDPRCAAFSRATHRAGTSPSSC
jgi:two-component system phosphate regulon response regulator PhoB